VIEVPFSSGKYKETKKTEAQRKGGETHLKKKKTSPRISKT